MQTQETTPNPTPQPESLRGRIKRPVTREQYYLDWSQYPSIWHLPNRWIADALKYSRTGVALARHREAPESLKEEPADPKVWLQIAYPLVEGKRWSEEDILELLIKVEDLQTRLSAACTSIQQLKVALAEAGIEEPQPPKPQPKTWNLLRWILGGGAAAAAALVLIAKLAGGAK